MSGSLTALGWDSEYAGRFNAFCMVEDVEATPGRVIAVDRGAIDVASETGTVRVQLRPERPNNDIWPPIVGDWVGFGQGEILFVLPRKTFLEKPSSNRGRTGQAIASNIDVVLIADPLPSHSLGRVERMVALARHAGLEAWLIATKSDLVTELHIQEVLESVGTTVDRVFVTTTADIKSFTSLKNALKDHGTGVIFGRSGAGKSTLVNMLVGANQATEEVRESDGKGRHKTTRRTLHSNNGITIIDSPGVREIAAVTSQATIDDVYTDIVALAQECFFSDCSHDSEPDCAVQQAISENLLDPDQLVRFRRMSYEARRYETGFAREHRRLERKASKDAKRGRRYIMEQKRRLN